ncbi:MAG: hypothetical protein KA754_03425 [Corallincola sp.]|nr:hypothetical protein [Corallincola sp.]
MPQALADDLWEKSPQRRSGHLRYSIDAGEWRYWGPRRHHLLTGEPYGVISGSWNIERVKQQITLPLDDHEALQRYLADDYDIYLNGEGGPNWDTRQQITKRYRGVHNVHLVDSIEQSIEQAVASCSLKVPSDYQVTHHLPVPWLRYLWQPRFDGLVGLDAVLYSIVLDPRHLLTVSFSVIRDLPGHDHHWLPRALDDIDKVMHGTRVTFKRSVPQHHTIGSASLIGGPHES